LPSVWPRFGVAARTSGPMNVGRVRSVAATVRLGGRCWQLLAGDREIA
jgi:hypothetical protein